MRVLSTLVLLLSTTIAAAGTVSDQKEAAKQFVRGLYGCDASVVSKYASKDVKLSYPVFERIFKKPVISGSTDVIAFSKRFCTRWKNATFKFHRAVEEGNNVVLIWSFSAESSAEGPEMPPVGTRSSWGGISLFEFDDNGKIRLELGEESTPGPEARLEKAASGRGPESR